jgi:hypothetical protein
VKELRGSAVNFSYIETPEHKLVTLAEVVLIRSEPTYRVDDGGGMIRQRVLDEIRFATTAGGLRELAERMTGWATEMELDETILKDVRVEEPDAEPDIAK